MRPPGPAWPMPPPQQQLYPHNPAVSVHPPTHLGYHPQQLFPVHGMGMTVPTSSDVANGVTLSSSPAMPVSQPLFPVVNSITPSQASVNAYPPNNSFPGLVFSSQNRLLRFSSACFGFET